MRVSIWDLDYYYSPTKVNCFNTDVMRISSYHKQKGDQVNFVQKQDDIDRPFDLYYIIKEKDTTPNPPVRFFLLSSVKWWGTAYKHRIHWKMPAAMLACRPDYLLYPEKETIVERSEYIQLLDSQGQPLPFIQDYHNTFKNKKVFVSDRYLWQTNSKIICQALERLKDVQNLSFLHPIRIDLIIRDKDVRERFKQLNLGGRSQICWDYVSPADAKQSILFKEELETLHPKLHSGAIQLKLDTERHWENVEFARQDFCACKQLILFAKEHNQVLQIKRFKRRLDSPYFFVFETFSNWTTGTAARSAWLQYLEIVYPRCDIGNPASWTPPYRELLCYTWDDADFMLTVNKTIRLADSRIPWALLKNEFKWGI